MRFDGSWRGTRKCKNPTMSTRARASRREARDFPAQHSYRSFGKSECSLRVGFNNRRDRRTVRIGMAVRPIVDPNILFTAKSHECDWAPERRALSLAGVERDANGVWIVLITIHQHQRPVSIRTMDCVRSHELISVRIFYLVGRCEHLMYARVMLHPLQVNHVRGVVERRVS